MRADVESWCDSCEVCKANHGVPAVSAWTRTTLYSHPFRCLQFDTVDCGVDKETGDKYLLTVVCLFSRWCWAIPLREKTAAAIGEALLREVFGPWGIWSTVLRSDNAREFLARTIQYINQKLETEHITGPVYHPQAQGAVERLHRKINDFMRAVFSWVKDERRGCWVAYIPFVVGMLRTMKMASLGNRSPMMIVTGLDPKLPITLSAGLPVSEIGVDEYILGLMRYLEDTYEAVRDKSLELARKTEGTQRGSPDQPLRVGDFVLRIKPTKDRPHGTTRFESRTDSSIYRIRHAIGENTFELEFLDGTGVMGPNDYPVRVSADTLIRLDMPELESLGIPDLQPRELELQDHDDHHVWHRARLERVLPDARVVLRYDRHPRTSRIVDLTKERYRWLQIAAPVNQGE